jgi:hypothetical protein
MVGRCIGSTQQSIYHYKIEMNSNINYCTTHLDVKKQFGITRSSLNKLVGGHPVKKYKHVTISRVAVNCNAKLCDCGGRGCGGCNR